MRVNSSGDNFKAINDTHGHAAGDKVLIEVARRLTALSRNVDTVARFGGDEFILLSENIAGHEDLWATADRIVDALRVPFPDQGCPSSITASVGVAMTKDPSASGEHLVRDADAAMYQAKEGGRDQWRRFESYGSGIVEARSRSRFHRRARPAF